MTQRKSMTLPGRKNRLRSKIRLGNLQNSTGNVNKDELPIIGNFTIEPNLNKLQ